MEAILFIIAKTAAIMLDVIAYAMMARMLLPFFLNPEESRIYQFVYCISEPFVVPVRYFLVKFNLLQNSIIDWSFTVSYLILVLLRYFLPAI